MSIKGSVKNITDTIKYKDETVDQQRQDRNTIRGLSLALAVITSVMSWMNYNQQQHQMMVATLILTALLVCIFVLSLLVKVRKLLELMLCVALSALCVYFALTGGNEGFAILWALLFPPAAMLLMELIYGTSIGLFFEVFFIVLFWTPLREVVSEYYSQTFMMRFPMLYTAFFFLSFLAKYLLTKKEIAEHNYIRTIENLSMIDQLTRLPNRRSFEERLNQEWNRAVRNQEPLSILFVDVDKFKVYNDTFGHLQGDRALQAVAEVFSKALKRSMDFVARWGGEEFAILLPNTKGDQAFSIADKVREQMAVTDIPREDGEITNVTISMGINSITPSLDCSVDDFIRCADDALYTAKHEGRNRVCRYTEQQSVS
ncbi:MAG: GGDEF domain-containing protein [Oscillospiraceae bacterium]|nr:GGDEF domain-containing protein [Oscillospiraceae bacterium]